MNYGRVRSAGNTYSSNRAATHDDRTSPCFVKPPAVRRARKIRIIVKDHATHVSVLLGRVVGPHHLPGKKWDLGNDLSNRQALNFCREQSHLAINMYTL